MKRGLELKLLNYFLLITLAALMIGVEFVFELNDPTIRHEIFHNVEQAILTMNADSIDDLTFAPLLHLRNKIVIMFGVFTVVVAIVLMMFIRNITTPLQRMVNVAKDINDGDLSQIIPIESGDEIGHLGLAINELTSNLQEITAFSYLSSEKMINELNELKTELNQTFPALVPQIVSLEKQARSLNEFAGAFELLKIDLKEFH